MTNTQPAELPESLPDCTVRLTADIPEYGMRRGDSLVIRGGEIVQCRSLAPAALPDAVLDMIAALTPSSPARRLLPTLPAAGSSPGAPPRPPRASLRLL
jgi:hypothetical protein